jgi:hypothetical protein
VHLRVVVTLEFLNCAWILSFESLPTNQDTFCIASLSFGFVSTLSGIRPITPLPFIVVGVVTSCLSSNTNSVPLMLSANVNAPESARIICSKFSLQKLTNDSMSFPD